MHSSRAYLLEADGHIIDRIDLTCGDDESAKARAREFVNDTRWSLWDGARMVATFGPRGDRPRA